MKENWIRTADRLPKMNQNVIIAREFNPGEPLLVETGYMREGGWWKVYGTNVKRGILYWMPLPEPPELGIEEEIQHVGYDDAQMGREK